jgi:hypothetical protein
VRLIPRALGQRPPDWETIREFTLYQHSAGEFTMNVPGRIKGSVRAQQEIELARRNHDYRWLDGVRDRYLEDLETLRQESGTDWRPFDGPLHLSVAEQNDSNSVSATFIESQMGLTVVDAREDPASISVVGATTYRIYPGGKQYNVESLPTYLANVTYAPDPEENPLGIFYRSSDRINVHDNVQFQGTLIAESSWSGDVHIYGEGVTFAPFDLPPLDGSEDPVRLPTLALEDDLRIYGGSSGSITGLVFAGDDIDIKEANQDSIDMKLVGRFQVHDFKFNGRDEWDDKSKSWWNDRYSAFMAQREDTDGIGNFVTYLAKLTDLDPTPRIVFERESATVDYHWQDFSEPIFMPHEDDEGLRWDLLDWTENP